MNEELSIRGQHAFLREQWYIIFYRVLIILLTIPPFTPLSRRSPVLSVHATTLDGEDFVNPTEDTAPSDPNQHVRSLKTKSFRCQCWQGSSLRTTLHAVFDLLRHSHPQGRGLAELFRGETSFEFADLSAFSKQDDWLEVSRFFQHVLTYGTCARALAVMKSGSEWTHVDLPAEFWREGFVQGGYDRGLGTPKSEEGVEQEQGEPLPTGLHNGVWS